MAVNLHDLTWLCLINNYIENSDIDSLEKEIRANGVPAKYGGCIADILIGRLEPKPQGKDRFLKSIYFETLSEMKNKNVMIDRFNDVLELPIRYGFTKPWKRYNDTDIKKIIAHKCYQGNYETARRMINKKIVNEGWEKLNLD